MILENLTICDFRVFSGEHSFNLAPRSKYGHKRPIILFGGLNGSGKTSILNAIRLGLYGRHSLGAAISHRAYHEYLLDSIHKSRILETSPNSASIKLTFSYGRHGQISEFIVRRSWTRRGTNAVDEHLSIFRDGLHLKEFGYEQCQAFLNELIPIGVSDLFFFDGEKISELAEDDTGGLLRHAVRKLLGLDLIERLRNDLAIYLRRHRTAGLPTEAQASIEELEKRLSIILHEKDCALSDADEVVKQMAELERNICETEIRIDEHGGAWARTRSDEMQRQVELLTEKRVLEAQVKELLSGCYPFAFAETACANLVKQLEREAVARTRSSIRDTIRPRIATLRNKLPSILSDKYIEAVETIIDETFSSLLSIDEIDLLKIKHDLADTDFNKLRAWIGDELPHAKASMSLFRSRIAEIEELLSTSSLRIERAPDEASLRNLTSALKELTQRLGQLKEQFAQHRNRARLHLQEAIEIARKIQKLHAEFSHTWRDTEAIRLAGVSRDILETFGEITTKRRVSELEDEFNQSFRRLARKIDINLYARIDPTTFEVALYDRNNRVSKNELSAGEKQIYAIAVLEALAKTSGRRLPVIIDTPLGRLDSHHRAKLVEHYFPRASHQVIILSTDTEVDRAFYDRLSPEISRAYHIRFNGAMGASTVEEGYFWRKSGQELRNAS
jgi:DNA sulfur modification protein DndD